MGHNENSRYRKEKTMQNYASQVFMAFQTLTLMQLFGLGSLIIVELQEEQLMSMQREHLPVASTPYPSLHCIHGFTIRVT